MTYLISQQFTIHGYICILSAVKNCVILQNFAYDIKSSLTKLVSIIISYTL